MAPAPPRTARAPGRMTPLEYLLAVLNDPEADPIRRDRAAIAAAPFCHPKAAPMTKRERQEMEAMTAERDTFWEDVLN